MSNREENKELHKRILANARCCELCGRSVHLEVHHVIPLCCAMGNVDLDVEENLIAICERCHSRLTNRRLLGMLGIEKAKFVGDKQMQFYKRITGDECAADICDYVDDVFKNMKSFLKVKNKKRKEETA